MRTIKHLALLALALTFVTGCEPLVGDGDVVTETRAVDVWTRLRVEDGLSVRVESGPVGAVAVRADENLIDAIETIVEGDTLIVRVEREHEIVESTALEVRVTADALRSVDASGGSRVMAQFAASRVAQLDASGGSVIDASGLDSEDVELTLSGGSHASLEGRADALGIDASGASTVEATALHVRVAGIDASGGAELALHVTESVSGDLSGGSVLTISGGADTSRVSRSGGAAIELR
jgi:hypothetical protein